MTRKILLIIVGTLGLACVVLGLSWNALFPPAAYWSTQKAQEYRDAFRAAHAAQDAKENGTSTGNDDELNVARDRFERIQQELSQIQTARNRSGKKLVVAGLILLLATVLLRHFWASPIEDHGR